MMRRRRHSATYKVQSRSIIKNQCMLSRSEFFNGSSEKFLHELSTMLEVDLFLPGQDIIIQGEEGDKMYFLNWGSVQVMLGDQVVGEINSGNVFGEMALFSNGKRSCTVRATDTCDCRSVDQHRFQRLLNAYPEEQQRFEKLVAGRHQETTKLKQDIQRQNEPQEDLGIKLGLQRLVRAGCSSRRIRRSGERGQPPHLRRRLPPKNPQKFETRQLLTPQERYHTGHLFHVEVGCAAVESVRLGRDSLSFEFGGHRFLWKFDGLRFGGDEVLFPDSVRQGSQGQQH
eukprot:Skav225458  [mRNA]  locus=scaffold881:25271:32616:+ [translate_table: standard]